MSYERMCRKCRKSAIWIGLRCSGCTGEAVADQVIDSFKRRIKRAAP
jgi:hypothetical protein